MFKGYDYVFVEKNGEKLNHLKKGFWEAVSNAGLTRRDSNGKKERFRFHDLSLHYSRIFLIRE